MLEPLHHLIRCGESAAKPHGNVRKVQSIAMPDLSPQDFEFVLGTGIGDGSFGLANTLSGGKIYKYPRISITHGINQFQYLEWKADRLNTIFSRSTKLKRVYKKESRKGWKDFEGYCYRFVHSRLLPFYELFYCGQQKEKIITSKCLNYLGPASIGLLYMDDGSGGLYLEKNNRKLKSGWKTYEYIVPRIEFATNGYDTNSVNLLAKWITHVSGCQTGFKKKSNRIRIVQQDCYKFRDFIAAYVPVDCMQYKLDLETVKSQASP